MTVLLIDDDEDDRWLFAEALNRTAPHVRCYTAAGGKEALQELEDQKIPRPDVIFLDLNMPGMDGKKCLQLIKQDAELSLIPIIVYSTSNFHKDIEEARTLGATEFIIKPADYSQLCEMFRARFVTA